MCGTGIRPNSWERRTGEKGNCVWTCYQKNSEKAYKRTGTNKVLRMGVVPGRVWGSTDNKRKQLVIAAGKKPSVSLSFFLR